MIDRWLSAQEATDLLRYCLSDGAIVPGKHFRDELANEGLDMVDVQYVLRSGAIYVPGEQDIKTGDWKYRIEGFSPEGKIWLAIVFCFKANDRGFLITCFSVKGKSRA
jgi:hypothetical protein